MVSALRNLCFANSSFQSSTSGSRSLYQSRFPASIVNHSAKRHRRLAALRNSAAARCLLITTSDIHHTLPPCLGAITIVTTGEIAPGVEASTRKDITPTPERITEEIAIEKANTPEVRTSVVAAEVAAEVGVVEGISDLSVFMSTCATLFAFLELTLTRIQTLTTHFAAADPIDRPKTMSRESRTELRPTQGLNQLKAGPWTKAKVQTATATSRMGALQTTISLSALATARVAVTSSFGPTMWRSARRRTLSFTDTPLTSRRMTNTTVVSQPKRAPRLALVLPPAARESERPGE